MARVIQKNCGNDVLEVIKWREIVVIYVQSIILNLFIIVKNILVSLKCRFNNQISPTRNIFLKFSPLALIGSVEAKIQQNQSVKCPRQLMAANLGNHKYIKLKKTKLHYVESGAQNERVILLLHGFPDCFFGWRYQIPVLSQSHRVIALDLKGFNDSDKPHLRHNYRPNVICKELKDFLEALDIKTVTIIGHDLGGLVGWIFMLKFPETVAKFIAISAPHPNLYWKTTNFASIDSKWCKTVQLPFVPEYNLNNSDKFFDKFYKHLKDENASMLMENGQKCGGNELLNTYKYIFNSAIDWIGPLNYYRNFFFYRVKTNISVNCPCLIISGNEDPNYKLETIIKCGEFCENSTIRIIEGAGHFPHQSHWAEVNQLLMKTLGGSQRNLEDRDDNSSAQRGLVGRMINKMYGVGQHYGNLSNGNLFSGLTTT